MTSDYINVRTDYMHESKSCGFLLSTASFCVLINSRISRSRVTSAGFFNLFGFLPEAFQQIFSIFVADVLPVIVEGLADEIGLVREAALAAGQSLVLNFAQSKTDLLLPALEDGIINSDWRIRLSSVQLLGVMLLRLAGVSVKVRRIHEHMQHTHRFQLRMG
jgi:hypothetical protein